MIHKNGWRKKALMACELSGSRRLIFTILVHRADFMGRTRETQADLARMTGLTSRTIRREVPHLVAAGRVSIIQTGKGRRPHWYEISEFWEP